MIASLMEEWETPPVAICQALADPKRILILYALDQQPRHVSALAEALALPQPTVSRHLRVLRQQALVDAQRNGPAMVYRLTDRRVIEVLDTLRQLGLAAQTEPVAEL